VPISRKLCHTESRHFHSRENIEIYQMDRNYLVLALNLGAGELKALHEAYPVTQWTRQLSSFLIDAGFSLLSTYQPNNLTSVMEFGCLGTYGPFKVIIATSPCRRVFECFREPTDYDPDPFNLFGANDHLYERLGTLMGIIRNQSLSNEEAIEKWRAGILDALTSMRRPRHVLHVVHNNIGILYGMTELTSEREALYENVRSRSGPGPVVLHLRDDPE